MADKNKIAPLDTITMQELFENVYCTNAAVIKDLLYPGTYLFAGSPKIALETEAEAFAIKEKGTYMASYDLKNALTNGDVSDVKSVHTKLADQFGEEKAND